MPTSHFLDRMVDKQIDSSQVVEGVKKVLENPKTIGNLEYDKKGEPSIKYMNDDLIVAINPNSGNVITIINRNKKITVRK